MDRRTFLKTLTSLGASISLPVNLALAANKEIDAAWEAASLAWDLFEVSECRTLSYANFEEPKTRYDAYGFGDTSEVTVWMLENHYDLYQPIQDLYREHLREQDPSLDEGALEERVEDGWLDWYSNGAGSHHAAIDSIVDDWLSGEPDWANEWDDLYKTGNAQGAAYDHFLREDRDMLDALGIVIIEGECPGSSYFAAELHTDVAEANRIARDNGWSIRFVRECAT